MLPTKIELHNFTSYQDEIADLSGLHIAPLVGPNGSGKSSLIDAMLIGFFGEATKGGKKELDNYQPVTGETEGSVAIEFILRGGQYRIERSRNYAKKKSKLKLLRRSQPDETADWGGWIEIGGKSIDDTQRAIEELLRVDYRTFVNSSIILQKDSESFTKDMTDSERKEILAQILGLDIWDRVQEICKKQIRELQAGLKGVELQQQKLTETIDQKASFCSRKIEIDSNIAEKLKTIQEIEASISILTAKLASRPSLESQIKICDKQIETYFLHKSILENKLSNAIREIQQTQQKIVEQEKITAQREVIEQACEMEFKLLTELKTWEEKLKLHQELHQKLWKLTSERDKWEKNQAVEKIKLETDLKQAKVQSEVLDQVPCENETGKKCTLLTRAWAARESIPDIQQQYQKIAIQKNPHLPEIDKIQIEIELTEYVASKHENTKNNLVELQKLSRMKPALISAQERIVEHTQQIERKKTEIIELEEEIQQTVKQISEISAEQTQYSHQVCGLEPFARELPQKQAEVKKLRAEESGLNAEIGKITANLEQIQKAETELEKILTQTKESRQKLFIAEMLEKACNKKSGVPALIIENALPQIEAKANDFLQGIVGGRFQIRFDTQPEVKSTGELGEGCRVIVLDQGRKRPYKTYSGAEGFIINFALRIGIGLFLSHRAGAEIKLLVLDEGLGALDANNRQAVIEAIQKAAKYFERVLLITHIPELQDAFSQRIEVRKDDVGSKVKIVV